MGLQEWLHVGWFGKMFKYIMENVKGCATTNDYVVQPERPNQNVPNRTNSQKISTLHLHQGLGAKFKRHRARKGMNGCFMQQLTHNNTAQQQDTFHQASGAGVQCTLLLQQWDKRGRGRRILCLSLFFFFLMEGEWCRLNLLFREKWAVKTLMYLTRSAHCAGVLL